MPPRGRAVSQGPAFPRRSLPDLARSLPRRGRSYLPRSRASETARQDAEARFRMRIVATKRLFFEELGVLELTRRGP